MGHTVLDNDTSLEKPLHIYGNFTKQGVLVTLEEKTQLNIYGK